MVSESLSIAIQARDEASAAFENVRRSSGSATQLIEQHWKKVAVAGAALGGAIEAITRKQSEMMEQSRRLAASLDITEDEVRDLALSMTDVTFPLEDVLELMETGRQQGIRSAEGLKEYAEFWDMVGDATGDSGPRLAEASAGLRAVGIAAGEESQALAAFGFITQETTGNVGDLLTFLERSGPELREMGMDINDAAAFMGALEHELGMTARTARTEFRQAVNEASQDLRDAKVAIAEAEAGLRVLEEAYKAGEISTEDYKEQYAELSSELRSANDFLENNKDMTLAVADQLGLTGEQLEKYMDMVGESSDVIKDNADIHAESYTVMQRLQHRLSELTFEYGALFESASALTPALIAIGPAMKGVTMVAKGLAAVKGLLLIKIVAVIAIIAGLVTAVKHLWNENEAFRDFIISAWENIQEVGTAVWEGLQDVLQRFTDFFQQIWDDNQDIIEDAQETWEHLLEAGQEIFESLMEIIGVVLDVIGKLWDEHGENIMAIVKVVWDVISTLIITNINVILGIIKTVLAIIRGDWSGAWEAIKGIGETTWNAIKDIAESVWNALAGILSSILDRIRQAYSDAWDRIVGVIQDAWDSVKDFFYDKWQGLTGFFSDLWDDVTGVFRGAWDGLVGIVSGAVNTILGFINSMISGVESGINSIIGAINSIPSISIPDWVPGIGGNEFGLPDFSEVNLPEVPLMDTGGMVQGPGLFGVGAGVKEIVRDPGPTIGTIVINASTREGGRQAARGLMDEMHRRGIKLQGV